MSNLNKEKELRSCGYTEEEIKEIMMREQHDDCPKGYDSYEDFASYHNK